MMLESLLIEEHFRAQFASVILLRRRIGVLFDHFALGMGPSKMSDQFHNVRVVTIAYRAFNFIFSQSLDAFLVRFVVEVVRLEMPSVVLLRGEPFAADVAFKRAVIVFVMSPGVDVKPFLACELEVADTTLVSGAV